MLYEKKWFALFVIPILAVFILIVIVPLISGIYFSFTAWNGRMDQTVFFIGIQNYLDVFSDKAFMQAFKFTTQFVIANVIVINILGFGLALLVTQKLKISNFMRTIFFLPNLIGGLLLGFIWQFIFTGVFSSIGKLFNIAWLQGWLSTTETGFWGLVILVSWQMSGYIMIIYIAALQNIPPEFIEAADLEGVDTFQKVRYIIFPLVRPAFTISLFLTIANSFKLFDQNLSLTNGAPFRSTELLALNIYKTAFSANEFGVAQAKSVIFFFIVAIITLFQVFISKKKEVDY